MDEMIIYILNILDAVKEEDQKEIINYLGNYLMGKESLEDTVAFLGKQKNCYDYHSTYRMEGLDHDILLAAKESPVILQHLGRMLQLLQVYCEESYFVNMISALVYQEILTLKEICIDSGLGMLPILLLFKKRQETFWRTEQNLYEELYAIDSEQMESSISALCEENRLTGYAFLYGKGRGDITELCRLALVCLNKYLDIDRKTDFDKEINKHVVLRPIWAQINSEKEKQKQIRDSRDNDCLPLVQALVYLDFAVPELTEIYQIYTKVYPEGALNALISAIGQNYPEVGQEEIDDMEGWNIFWKDLQEITEKLELPKGVLFTWATASMMNSCRSWNIYIGSEKSVLSGFGIIHYGHCFTKLPFSCWLKWLQEDPKLAEEALTLAKPSERILLHRYLLDYGVTFPIEECETLVISSEPFNMGDTAEVTKWLLTGVGNPSDEQIANTQEWENKIFHECDNPFSPWGLIGYSPIPLRLFNLMVAENYSYLLYMLKQHAQDHMQISSEELADFFIQADHKQLMLEFLMKHNFAYIDETSYYGKYAYQTLQSLVKRLPEETAKILKGKKVGVGERLQVLDVYCAIHSDKDTEILIEMLGDSSKQIRQYVIAKLSTRPEIKEQILPLVEGKKKTLREAAEELLTILDGEGLQDEADGDVLAFCTKTLSRSAKNQINWVYDKELPQIRMRDSDELAPEVIVLWYLSQFLGAKDMEVPKGAEQVRAVLSETDLRKIATDIYHGWMSQGAPAKRKSVLILYGYHAQNEEILVLKRQINEWLSSSRGALASEATKALILSGSDLALLTVDDLSRKAKNKQVRRAASEAFEIAAKQLGVTISALGDRIIPTLGFNKRGEKIIDYGNRQFTATISPSLTITLQDSTGKVIKSLPKPNSKDDEEIAMAAKSDFTATKKSLKTVVTTQTDRLEQALATGRRWTVEAWQKLFVENPIMHNFATSLVWGQYDGDTLVESFRYMEDGSFTTADEDDYILTGEIGLVHPLDLSEETLVQWQEQLEDYEVTQPFLQVHRPVYLLAEEQKDKLVSEHVAGRKILALSLIGKLQKMGWYKGSVQDGGGFSSFYKEIDDLGVYLTMEYVYVSPDPSEETTLGQFAFYKSGAIEYGSYIYDKVDNESIVPLKDVSARFYSEIIYELEKATVTSTGINEHWEKESELKIL